MKKTPKSDALRAMREAAAERAEKLAKKRPKPKRPRRKGYPPPRIRLIRHTPITIDSPRAPMPQ